MMNNLEMTELEQQVDTLINMITELQKDNRALHNQLAKSAQERNQYQEKIHNATLKIKSMINQLKETPNE